MLAGLAVTCSVVGGALMLPVADAVELTGEVGALITVIWMIAPLESVAVVIRERSSAPIPAAFACASLFSNSSWTLYGFYVAKDAYLWAPNLVGALAALIQVMLLMVFGLPKAASAQAKRASSAAADKDAGAPLEILTSSIGQSGQSVQGAQLDHEKPNPSSTRSRPMVGRSDLPPASPGGAPR
mmetsp:Transcript_35417/g.83856  ORF Transcript_35417/g.83856 Transcript_35417/m.83856 type:complete len:184 (+) Transcript_35417:579-1130(+)